MTQLFLVQHEHEIRPENFKQSQYNPSANIRDNSALLMDALGDLESSIISVQDYRRSSKEKTALIVYFGNLLRCFYLSKKVVSS